MNGTQLRYDRWNEEEKKKAGGTIEPKMVLSLKPLYHNDNHNVKVSTYWTH